MITCGIREGSTLNEFSNVFWLDRQRQEPFASVQGDLCLDVAIVGGGIAGLHAALGLRGSGLKVALLEARRIGLQATGRSTAKVTSQHGVKYEKLISTFGRDKATLYAAANERAKSDIATICSSLPRKAELEAKPAYIYARNDEEMRILQKEANAAVSLGLPADLLPDAGLPLPHTGALRFSDQFQFDPYLYLGGLARFVGPDVTIFENSRVKDIAGDGPFQLQLDTGVVTAEKVIVATQMPVIADGMFFAKAYPFAHPVAAAPLPDEVSLNGMFISAGSPSLSLRTATRGGRTFLIAAGAEFKTGDEGAANEAIEDLLQYMRQYFRVPKASHIWVNEDFRPMDNVPFIGSASSGKPDLLIATGFDAWGITQGAVAGEILAALAQGKSHAAADLYDATRLKPLAGGPTFVAENAKTVAHMASERLLRSRAVSMDDIEPGQGGVVERDGEQWAVRKAEDGTVTVRSAICTHLGCVVGWNATDRTWDCSCHGSRFTEDGQVLSGPAVEPLAQPAAPTDGSTK